jgi:hypothetical protein
LNGCVGGGDDSGGGFVVEMMPIPVAPVLIIYGFRKKTAIGY